MSLFSLHGSLVFCDGQKGIKVQWTMISSLYVYEYQSERKKKQKISLKIVSLLCLCLRRHGRSHDSQSRKRVCILQSKWKMHQISAGNEIIKEKHRYQGWINFGQADLHALARVIDRTLIYGRLVLYCFNSCTPAS